jgi:hypothetical protein
MQDNYGKTHTEYVILTAFPQHQYLQERASMLRYTYFACLVSSLHVAFICCFPQEITQLQAQFLMFIKVMIP